LRTGGTMDRGVFYSNFFRELDVVPVFFCIFLENKIGNLLLENIVSIFTPILQRKRDYRRTRYDILNIQYIYLNFSMKTSKDFPLFTSTVRYRFSFSSKIHPLYRTCIQSGTLMLSSLLNQIISTEL
jgi:hypothetical protein